MSGNRFAQLLSTGGSSSEVNLPKTPSTKASLGNGGAAKNHDRDTFFRSISIKPENWNKLFPYRLIIVKPNRSGSYDTISGQREAAGGIGGDLDKTEFTLPITPQDLSILDPFAISISATLRGIIEEHNGIKFKMIKCAGTTGIWPARSDAPPVSIPTIPIGGGAGAGVNSLTAGTREAFGDLIDSGKELFGFDSADLSINSPNDTGYELLLQLEQFLEAYVTAKKDPANNNWRLAFDNAKDNETLLVVPTLFTRRKSAASPLEGTYQFELKAWKRVTLNNIVEAADGVTDLRLGKDGNFWQSTLDKLSQARRLISRARNVIAAVRNDINGPLDAMRQVVMAVKDIAGVVLSLIDLPNQVANDYRKFFAESKQLLKTIFESEGQSSEVSKAFKDLTKVLDQKKGAAALTGSNAIASGITTSAESIFDDPVANFDFFDAVTIDTIPVTTEINEAIQDEIDIATALTNDDLAELRQTLLDIASDLEDSFGAGSATFASINGRAEPTPRTRPMSIEEFEIIAAFHEFIQALDSMTSVESFEESLANNETVNTNKIAFVSDLAVTNEIPFIEPISKILIPLPFGATLEQIAHTFLEDADRWNEIATLNNLRSPYIDEEGTNQLFLSNGGGRQLNINDGSDLWIGQRIELFSNTVPLFFRKIISVEQISQDNWLVTVDGKADLNKMKTANNASMTAFQSGTVNSQDKIFLPSTLPAPENSDLNIATFQDTDNPLLGLAKVDFLLTPDNDLALNNQGDARIANGLTNLIQAMKLKVITERNSLFDHPGFGLGISVGSSIADITGPQLLNDLTAMVVSDSRFSSIRRLSVNFRNGALFMDLAVNLQNDSGILPLSFPLGVR